jgi:RimJ/RimL family protein N-acetyltransferase
LRQDFVVLRPGRPADVVERRSLGKHAAIDRMYGVLDTRDGPMTATEAQEWLAAFSNRTTPHKWIIEADGHLVGEIRLDSTSRDDVRSLAIGLCHPDDLGRGIGGRALRLVTADAFDRLDVRRITIRVLDYNDRAIRAYAACGFEEVRREPSGVVVDGHEHDDVIMVLDR